MINGWGVSIFIPTRGLGVTVLAPHSQAAYPELSLLTYLLLAKVASDRPPGSGRWQLRRVLVPTYPCQAYTFGNVKAYQRTYPCQAYTFGNVKALGHRRAADGAVAYAMQLSEPVI